VNYQELKRRLNRLGFHLERQGTRHEYWESDDGSLKTLIPRHRGEVPTGTLASILRDLDLTQDDIQGRGRQR